MKTGSESALLQKVTGELDEGMKLAKCRRCGCMKDTLEAVARQAEREPADTCGAGDTSSENRLAADILRWQSEMEPVRYACLGCDYCYPAVAMNELNQAYPDLTPLDLECGFEVKETVWPPVPGEYKILSTGDNCPVALSTLGSPELVDMVSSVHPEEVCIVGKTETENIGIDKVIRNTITNRAIRYLVLAGSDPAGHLPGQTIMSLSANGVDERMRVIGSKGKRPILRNVTAREVESFRDQVEVIDMIGCEDVEAILQKIRELAPTPKQSCGCAQCTDPEAIAGTAEVPTIEAAEPERIQMDKAGYFVVLPQERKGTILVEHYDYGDKLLRRIEGWDARSLYWTIIEGNWVTQLSHSAYLGKELAKAELSLKHGFKYSQGGA